MLYITGYIGELEILTNIKQSFIRKYGVIDEIGRYKMLLHAAKKARLAGKRI